MNSDGVRELYRELYGDEAALRLEVARLQREKQELQERLDTIAEWVERERRRLGQYYLHATVHSLAKGRG